MSTRSSLLAPYHRNSVLQLISASGVGFLLYQLTVLCFIVYTKEQPGLDRKLMAHNTVDPVVGLAPLQVYASHWWTVLLYGWAHTSFWDWFSNMLWLYCFGSIVQSLVGYKQVIPAFVYGLLIGGVACLLTQFIPGEAFRVYSPLMTAQAGIMALAAAALTLAPSYRIYLGESFSIPLLLVFGIFLAFNVASYANAIPVLMLGAGGLLSGFLYARVLKAGYQPGAFVYDFFARMTKMATPDPLKTTNGTRRKKVLDQAAGYQSAQQRVDDILDKINRKGYTSLTKEEKDLLMKASQEAND